MTKLTDIYKFLPLGSDLLTSGQPTEDQFGVIAESGVKAVINLALSTSSNALPHEAEIIKRFGMEYIHIPVEWDAPSPAALTQFMDTMDTWIGKRILIHCAANMRVPTFIALYRILRLGWTEEKAFESVYEIWNPYNDPGWSEFIIRMLSSQKK